MTISSIADQLSELEIQYSERMEHEVREIRAAYEDSMRTMQESLAAHRNLTYRLAFQNNIITADISPAEIDKIAEFLCGRLDMAKDFERIITHIKTDETLMDIWDNLCLMMKMREEI